MKQHLEPLKKLLSMLLQGSSALEQMDGKDAEVQAVEAAINSVVVEPKSELQYGVWMNDDRCWGWKGPVIAIEFDKKTPEHCGGTLLDFVFSRCPACEQLRARFRDRKVKRWMILPP